MDSRVQEELGLEEDGRGETTGVCSPRAVGLGWEVTGTEQGGSQGVREEIEEPLLGFLKILQQDFGEGRMGHGFHGKGVTHAGERQQGRSCQCRSWQCPTSHGLAAPGCPLEQLPLAQIHIHRLKARRQCPARDPQHSWSVQAALIPFSRGAGTV